MDDNSTMSYSRLNVTIPPDAYKKLEDQAKKEKRSISNMIYVMIDTYLEENP